MMIRVLMRNHVHAPSPTHTHTHTRTRTRAHAHTHTHQASNHVLGSCQFVARVNDTSLFSKSTFRTKALGVAIVTAVEQARVQNMNISRADVRVQGGIRGNGRPRKTTLYMRSKPWGEKQHVEQCFLNDAIQWRVTNP